MTGLAPCAVCVALFPSLAVPHPAREGAKSWGISLVAQTQTNTSLIQAHSFSHKAKGNVSLDVAEDDSVMPLSV